MGDIMIKLATFKDDKYGLVTEFLSEDDRILFAYTRAFNNKYTYMLVSEVINNELIEKYLKNE